MLKYAVWMKCFMFFRNPTCIIAGTHISHSLFPIPTPHLQVGPGEVDEDLEDEVGNELTK